MGESLLNDGIGAAITQVVLSLVIRGSTVDVRFITFQIFFKILLLVGGGVCLGLLIGYIANRIILRLHDSILQTSITVMVAYGSYILAQDLHLSGIMGIITAGFLVRNNECQGGNIEQRERMIDNFWEVIVAIANSLLFLLIGIQIGSLSLTNSLSGIAWAVVGVVVGRVLMIYLSISLNNLLRVSLARFRSGSWLAYDRIPPRWNLLLLCSGLRGPLSMALVLSLPPSIPQRTLLITLVYGVILVTLVGNGCTHRLLLPLLRRENQQEAAEPLPAYMKNQ